MVTITKVYFLILNPHTQLTKSYILIVSYSNSTFMGDQKMKITITYEYENEETKVCLFLVYFFHDLSIRLWERLHSNSKFGSENLHLYTLFFPRFRLIN